MNQVTMADYDLKERDVIAAHEEAMCPGGHHREALKDEYHYPNSVVYAQNDRILALEDLLEEAYPEMLLLKYRHHPSGSYKYVEWQGKAKKLLSRFKQEES